MNKLRVQDYASLGFHLGAIRMLIHRDRRAVTSRMSLSTTKLYSQLYDNLITEMVEVGIRDDDIERLKKTKGKLSFIHQLEINQLKQRLNVMFNEITLIIERSFDFASAQIGFILTDQRTLSVDRLLVGSSAFFNSESIFKKVAKGTRRDLDEGVRCLLYGLPTSAGILFLRAVESELKVYYKMKLGKKPNETDTWGKMLTEIKKVSTASINGHLDYLRDAHRNKLAHAGGVLEQQEAERMCMIVIDTITSMVKSGNRTIKQKNTV